MGQKRHNTLDIRANHHLHYSSTPIPELTWHHPILMSLKMGQSTQSEMIMSCYWCKQDLDEQDKLFICTIRSINILFCIRLGVSIYNYHTSVRKYINNIKEEFLYQIWHNFQGPSGI